MSTSKEFELAVLTFGSDLDRWPAKTLERYAALIASGDVDDVLTEARALDAALSHAPGNSQQREEIVAAAIMRTLPEGAPVERATPELTVDGFANLKNGPNDSTREAAGTIEAWKLPTINAPWRRRGASLLAASFVLGLAAGAGGVSMFVSNTSSQVGVLADDALFAELAPLLDDQDEENWL